jgi:sugar lactone lactonase YvrE
MRDAERVTGPLAYHGEGPFWDARTGRLLCMDVLAGEIVARSLGGVALPRSSRLASSKDPGRHRLRSAVAPSDAIHDSASKATIKSWM